MPFTLRYQFAFDATPTGLRRATVREGIPEAQRGAITAIQRFASA